ncbi:ORF6N domain-containing protein [bacterium AH-315-M05]|nr:ORF6N domain-containing protein [bacterium AH-315-M05]
MSKKMQIIPVERVDRSIILLRGYKVMLDTDLAEIYGVTTKQLNQAVKRNIDRFPEDFMFRLTEKEKIEVVTICDHLQKLKFSPHLPYAFTEHGAVMLASVLNSPVAIKASIQVVRAFVRLREILATHKELAHKLEQLEKKYDKQFRVVFDAIKKLMAPPTKPRVPIGYQIGGKSKK